MKTIEIEVRGNTYLWNGQTWTDDRFLTPPSNVRGQLMARLQQKLTRTPLKKLDADLAVRVAQSCAEEGHYEEAQKLAQRALKASPRHVGAAIALAELFRKQRLPRRALKVTDAFTRRRNAELLTVRAAAFCDISDWDNAEKLVRRALAIDKAEATPDTLQVMARVVAARTREAA